MIQPSTIDIVVYCYISLFKYDNPLNRFFSLPQFCEESRRIAILEKRAQEQFEKDKDEMLSKLKDLGNTVLGRLGIA